MLAIKSQGYERAAENSQKHQRNNMKIENEVVWLRKSLLNKITNKVLTLENLSIY